MLRKKIISLISLFLFSGALIADTNKLAPIENLDLEKYQGLWNQMAAIPASFQDDCVANTTAEYSLLDDGLVKVVNSCDRAGGKRKSSEARARINPDFNMTSKLEVTFVKIFKWIWTFAGDYWVLYISDDYDVALVGDPDYKFGWILSKKESLSNEEYIKLAKELTTQGYDTCRFLMSSTPGQEFSEDVRLCDFIAEEPE